MTKKKKYHFSFQLRLKIFASSPVFTSLTLSSSSCDNFWGAAAAAAIVVGSSSRIGKLEQTLISWRRWDHLTISWVSYFVWSRCCWQLMGAHNAFGSKVMAIWRGCFMRLRARPSWVYRALSSNFEADAIAFPEWACVKNRKRVPKAN